MTTKDSDFQSLIDQHQLPKLPASSSSSSIMNSHLLEEQSPPQIDFGFLDYQMLSERQDANVQHSDLQKWLSNCDFESPQQAPAKKEDSIQELVSQVMGKLDQKPKAQFSQNTAAKSQVPAHPSPASITPLFAKVDGEELTDKAAAISQMVESLVANLRQNKKNLLNLNPSRRQHLLAYLNVLSGTQSLHHRFGDSPNHVKEMLNQWIEHPNSSSQEAALQTYLEEVALIFIGQAILLKTWADRGIRNWSVKDLGKLNWTLAKTLSPHVPNGREGGWQITKSNLYSWYRPEEDIQTQIFSTLNEWDLADEGPHFIARLMRQCRRFLPNMPELSAYDERFFNVLWEKMDLFGFKTKNDFDSQMRRKRLVFSPTLRDGALIRSMPEESANDHEWIGLELNPFQILVLEMGKLWGGPKAPPLWSAGCGLEVHNRDQLSMEWQSRKPTLEKQISEMEACDLGFVIEERSIRAQGRSPQASYLRTQLEQLPYFKDLKSNDTTMGDLQACVTLSKLRQGGLLWWIRSERLGVQDGQNILDFLLERSKMVCEWDLSAVQTTMPQNQSDLFPRYLYLFEREGDMNVRNDHFPRSVSVRGAIKSHVEVPVLLSDAFESLGGNIPQRGNWKVQCHQSPSSQKEWLHQWPDASTHQAMEQMEDLKSRSVILGSFATILPLKKDHKPTPRRGKLQSPPALCVSVVHEAGETQIKTRVLSPDQIPSNKSSRQEFIVSVPELHWAPALAHYLASPAIAKWLSLFCEMKKGKLVIKESTLKFIPIPKQLVAVLRQNPRLENPQLKEWVSEIAYSPEKFITATEKNPELLSEEHKPFIYMKAAEALEHCKKEQEKLLSIVGGDGGVKWDELMQIVPENQRLIFSVHPKVRLSGNLPPHVPITRIEQKNGDQHFGSIPSLTFATERGLQVNVGCNDAGLLDILWSQVKDLNHSTWGELTQFVYLPRELDFAHNMARQILSFHEVQQKKCEKICTILTKCSDL